VLDLVRAVLVERRDAFGRRHELRAGGVRGRPDEVHDGLLGGAVVPRGQRVLGIGTARCQNQADQKGNATKSG